MTRLFIAEKPSVAKAIAAELGVTNKGQGFIQCGEDFITWCFGHMLEQEGPDFYTPADVPTAANGKKIWRVEDLPIIPKTWVLKPKDDAKKQLKVIADLIKKASHIVNAGDPDREGQLLVDEVLELNGNEKPVTRFWVSAQDSVTVKRGLDNLENNQDYLGWGEAAKARQRADWLIGMNLSRAYTLRAQRGGSRALLTVGRVQTPTLNLVVSRDREIESFKPTPYYLITASVEHEKNAFNAKWKPQEDAKGLDAEGRLVDGAVVEAMIKGLPNVAGEVVSYIQESKKTRQPLAYSLSKLTLIASNKFGYSAEEVLNICQSLYETHKLTSYPRSDCAYLPESQHADSKQVLEAVKHVNGEMAALIDAADTNIKSRVWNDKQVTAHHGIIPTMHKGNKEKLSAPEANIYLLIVTSYLAQFYPDHEFEHTTVEAKFKDDFFAASGRIITKNGWKSLYQAEDSDDEDEQDLPIMKEGDSLVCGSVTSKQTQTKPPARFTDGTLVMAMENIHKYVDDPAHKKMLRDEDGIGTVATRSSIVKELMNRGFMELKGKKLISTTIGRAVVDALPNVVKSPVLTALYERMLKDIEQGKATLETFIARQEKLIREEVQKANTGSVVIAGAEKAVAISETHKCELCGNGLSRRPTKKRGVFWWGCSNYPNCKQTYPDIKGSPNFSKGNNNKND